MKCYNNRRVNFFNYFINLICDLTRLTFGVVDLLMILTR